MYARTIIHSITQVEPCQKPKMLMHSNSVCNNYFTENRSRQLNFYALGSSRASRSILFPQQKPTILKIAYKARTAWDSTDGIQCVYSMLQSLCSSSTALHMYTAHLRFFQCDLSYLTPRLSVKDPDIKENGYNVDSDT